MGTEHPPVDERAPRAADRWPLVGRQAELELFRQSLADPHRDAFVLVGAAGVGKTRLADECLARAAADGLVVARAVATAVAARIPLGALIHLLPPTDRAADRGADGLPEVAGLFERARRSVRMRSGGRRLVLFVDDIDLLDPVSLRLIGQLRTAGEVFVVATMRPASPVPEVHQPRWTADRTATVELRELDRPEIDVLLRAVLGGPVTAATATALWRASRGNVLLVRELVIGAIQESDLVVSDGVWRLLRLPAPTARLHELIEARIAALGAEARHVLEVLALCEPLDLTTLTRHAAPEVLERLEDIGLIEIAAAGRRRSVTLAHPMHVLVVRERMSRLRADRILRAQIQAVRDAETHRHGDALRVAIWQLDLDGTADPDLLLRAARLSRTANDFAQVERLSRAARDAAADPGTAAEAAVLLGEALASLGRITEADEVFAVATVAAPPDVRLHRIVVLQALNLSWGLLHPERALGVVEQARGRLPVEFHDELLAVTALVLMLCYRPQDALDVLAGLPGRPDGATRMVERLARTTTLAILGRTSEALAAAHAPPAEPDDRLLHAAYESYALATALYEAGRIAEAIAETVRGLDMAVRDEMTAVQTALTYFLGRCHLAVGRPQTAQRWFREAVAISRVHGLDDQLKLALAGLAMAHAHVGDAAGALAAATDLQRVPGPGDVQSVVPQGLAWSLAINGEVADALDRLSEAADVTAAAGQRALSAAFLHDMARLGAPERAVERMRALCADTDSPMIIAREQYVTGSARRDVVMLDAAAAAFTALGAELFAAEAVAEVHRHATDRKARASAAARAAHLRQHCESAATPPFFGIGMVARLSRREREICALAARGLANRDIATQLTISVRTVENHLQKAYDKLGVTQRTQLPAAMGLTVEPPPGID